jgi:peptide/nickel transport system ATP-binding protein
VEEGGTEDIFDSPNHPYTKALLREVPKLEDRKAKYNPIKGEIPSPLNPRRVSFSSPLSLRHGPMQRQAPRLKEIAPGRRSACYLNDKIG